MNVWENKSPLCLDTYIIFIYIYIIDIFVINDNDILENVEKLGQRM